MSMWYCPSHGLNGPVGCCARAERVEIRTGEPALTVPCDCESCRAARAYQYGGVQCCPRKLSHGVNCICGVTSPAALPSSPPAQDET